ncbi:MAG: MBL fold metallo-hydrolase [Longimicrobiales bacterium]|nr:MBL fold metallo-hydrolase [Longimicrobiales bacterium]
MDEAQPCSRRGFLRRSATHLAQVGLATAAWPELTRALVHAQERFPVVAAEPWGRIFRLGDGVWSLISNPLRDRTTLCNGGIVAGRNGVVVIEAFGSGEGYDWMADQARRLTGRDPTHVVVTHYHSDHTAGLGAAGRSGVEVLATPVTRDETRTNQNVPNPVLNRATPLDTIRPTEIDLGDRSLILVPRRGHTDSDVTVEVAEPSVVFCGDLVWNEMFPNYVDATPSRLTQAVTLIRASQAATYVPGHGPLVDGPALERYLDLLLHVEAAAMEAVQDGLTAAEAGAAYRLPEGYRDWTIFNDDYFTRAIRAWMEELSKP